jgi:cytochrome c biogenesis protein CcdA
MLALALLVGSIALVDSLNPSTIGPGLYLATGSAGRLAVAGFAAGVFSVGTAAGLIVTLGPGHVLLAAVPRPGHHVTHLIELALGGVLFLLAIGLWAIRERIARRAAGADERSARNSFLLGAGIMAVELPTALPYFAVIAAIIAGDENAVSQVVLLLLFNGIFVAPLLVILAIRSIARQRGLDALAAFRAQLNQRVAIIIPAIVLVAAAALLVLGAVGAAGD